MVQTRSFDRQEQYTNSVHIDIIVAHYLDLLLVSIRNSNIPKNPKASIYLIKILSNKFVRLIGPAMSISYVEQLSALESLFPLPVAYELGVIDKESTHSLTEPLNLPFFPFHCRGSIKTLLLTSRGPSSHSASNT